MSDQDRSLGQAFRDAIALRGVRSPYGNWPLFLLTALGVIELFGARAFSILLPDIQRTFKVNLRFIITAEGYTGILALLLAVPTGYLADRYRRTILTGISGIVESLGNLLTALLPGKTGLATARSIASAGTGTAPTATFSLIADYYPLDQRGKAFGLRYVGGSVGGLLAPVMVGLLGARFGWQLPFVVFSCLGLVAGVLVLFLPEPTRGYHERVASGADEDTARREQEPPSFGEAFRASRSVRTLRRLAYATPFFAAFSLGYAILFPFLLERVFGLGTFQRGVFSGVLFAVEIPALIIGGYLVDRLIANNPSRVFAINGVSAIVQVVAIGGMIFAPNLAVLLVIAIPLAFVTSIIDPAVGSVASLVIPARLRGLGLSTLSLWRVVGLIVVFPVTGNIADDFGVRAGLLALTPLALIGAVIVLSASAYVEFDIRSATAAAMASEAYRRARAEGRAKLLVLRDLDVRYESLQVLFGVDLDVREGELIALLGTNGAGKSTLLRAISGIQEATGGAILFDGRDITHAPPHEIARHRVAQTPGGRGIFPGLTVRENLRLAGWLYGEDPKHDDEVEEIFASFPVLREKLDQAAGTMSGGEQQMLTLAQAFLSRPRLLLIDELSLGLAPAVVERLLRTVRTINERGTTVIVVEQSVNVALTIAQRAVFLEKGQVRFDGPTAELLDRPDILRAVFLKSAASGQTIAPRVQTTVPTSAEGPPILDVHGLTKRYGGVTAVLDVTFSLAEGAVLGLIGPNGAGKTTVLEIVAGFAAADEGRVVYDGRDITHLSPEERSRARLLRRFQDARLFPSLTVAETLAVALDREVETRSLLLEAVQAPPARLSEARVRRRVDHLLELLELGGYREKFISELSTGTRRIVDLACVLAAEPRLLLLDEPSSGLAQRETESLVPLLRRVRRETGCSILVVEHDMPLISAVSDELLAMHLGRVLVRGAPDRVLEDERVVKAYLGTTQEAIARSRATR